MKKLLNLMFLGLIFIVISINFNSIVNFIVKVSESDGINSSYKDNEEIFEVEENIESLSDEDYDFDNEYYIYYSMLNDQEKTIYRQIYTNSIELVENFRPIENISVKELKETFEALMCDHPELFWLSNSYSYRYNRYGQCILINISFYFNKDNIEVEKERFNNELNKIVNSAKKYKTDYEKELYVHNYLINTINYTDIVSINQSAYSALINKKSVCAGYSKAFQLIMQKLNIVSYYVVGYAKENHAWNIVKIGDKYYNVDLTWNDTNEDKWKYFNISDKDISSTHTRLKLSRNLPKCY